MFLYKKKNAISKDLCQKFIETFENSTLKEPGKTYGDNPEAKVSTDITFHPGFLNNPEWKPLLDIFIPILQENITIYSERFSVGLSRIGFYEIHNYFNMQRYHPNEGFFHYHSERGIGTLDRLLVWMVYLNSLSDRGETEFYYQHHFETPEEGNLLIWPADWMYTHRGISSPTETKYILTGWVNFVNQ